MMSDKITINEIVIDRLKPLREGFKNKNNKLSAQGYYKNIKVKIYEVFDHNQGALREFISKHNELSSYFPKLISNNYRHNDGEFGNRDIIIPKPINQYRILCLCVRN